MTRYPEASHIDSPRTDMYVIMGRNIGPNKIRHIALRFRQYLLTRLSEGSKQQIDYALGLHHRTGFGALELGT